MYNQRGAMRRRYFLGVLSLIFLSFEIFSSCLNSFTCNSGTYAWNLVKCHPFITAAVIVIILNKEPWECIKETISYFIEEHSILCIILLGLIISGSLDDLSYIEHVGGTTMRYAMRAGSFLINIIERRLP